MHPLAAETPRAPMMLESIETEPGVLTWCAPPLAVIVSLVSLRPVAVPNATTPSSPFRTSTSLSIVTR